MLAEGPSVEPTVKDQPKYFIEQLSSISFHKLNLDYISHSIWTVDVDVHVKTRKAEK